MKKKPTIEDLEEYAFYESGLSADGCLEKLDDYARDCITKYGRILLAKQKDRYIAGFQGCCYACEPVGMLNQEMSIALGDTLHKLEEMQHQISVTTQQLNSYLL